MNSRNKLTLSIITVIITVGLAFVVACGANQPSSTPQAAAPKSGTTPTRGQNPQGNRPGGAQPTTSPGTPTPVGPVRVAVTQAKVAGNIVAANQASLTFGSGGRLTQLPVSEGTRVKAGTLLAALDTTTLEIQAAQAKAALDIVNASWNKTLAGPTSDDIALAKSNLDRAKAAVVQAQAAFDQVGGLSNPRIAMMSQSINLQQATLAYQAAVATYNLAVNHPTDSERAIGLAQLAQAQAAYDTARQSLNNARIVAPFDGTLVSITPKIGESVNANSPVMLFADLTQMQVLANIDETTLANVRASQTANIYVDALPDKVLTGRVKRVGLFATSTGNIVTVPVWIDIDKTDTALAPGWSATVEIATGQ